MIKYAFELGKQKELCHAELLTVLGKDNFIEKNLDSSIFLLNNNTDFKRLQDSLGGTIKIMEIIEEIPHHASGNFLLKELATIIEKMIVTEFEFSTGKIPFSISLVSFMNRKDINIKELLNFSKKIFKSLKLNARFVNKNFGPVKSSTIYKAKVLEKGIDICIIKGTNKLFVAKSISIQNIDRYSKRDYDKPARDAKIGMLPPKLAQIMINLAGNNPKTILDPFCGTGTVLMEGLLMNKDVIGSDLNPEMVKASELNCSWFEQEFYTKNKYRILFKDAQKLNSGDIPERIDAIITEGYLGSPQSSFPPADIQNRIFKELTSLHLNWLMAAKQFLPKTGKIVMCVAAFKDKTHIVHLPNFNQIAEKAGFEVTSAYTYSRPDQTVARDIKVLTHKK